MGEGGLKYSAVRGLKAGGVIGSVLTKGFPGNCVSTVGLSRFERLPVLGLSKFERSPTLGLLLDDCRKLDSERCPSTGSASRGRRGADVACNLSGCCASCSNWRGDLDGLSGIS